MINDKACVDKMDNWDKFMARKTVMVGWIGGFSGGCGVEREENTSRLKVIQEKCTLYCITQSFFYF